MLKLGSFLTSVLFVLGLGLTPVIFAGETTEEIMAEFAEEKMELKEDFKEDWLILKKRSMTIWQSWRKIWKMNLIPSDLASCASHSE